MPHSNEWQSQVTLPQVSSHSHVLQPVQPNPSGGGDEGHGAWSQVEPPNPGELPVPELPPPPESLPASAVVSVSFVPPQALMIAKKAQAAREQVTSA